MARPRKPILEDVAREAGVSTATVSRVLNGTGPVREEKRTLVLRAAARLSYTLNLHARTLAGGDSKTIGMIVSNLENPFFLDVYSSLEREALRLGHEVVVANTGYDPDRLAASARLMLGRRVTGIAAIVSEMPPTLLAELTKSGTPIVFYDIAGGNGRNVTNIRIDYSSVMRKMIELLYKLGHRDFAFVGHHTTLPSLSARRQAFTDTMEHYGRRVTYQFVNETDSLDGGRRAAHQLLDAPSPPTAIVCVNDLMAAGAIRTVRDLKLRVPDDVSVTGFDNVTLAEYVEPQLTTVDLPRAEIGRLVVERLVKRSARDRDITITPTLIVRESTGKAKKR